MNELVEKRAQTLAEYIVETGATVRAAAKRFDVSKSTVHTDVSLRLKEIDHDLYERVRVVLDENKAERHIRGGNATKEKYRKKRCSQMVDTTPKNDYNIKAVSD